MGGNIEGTVLTTFLPFNLAKIGAEAPSRAAPPIGAVVVVEEMGAEGVVMVKTIARGKQSRRAQRRDTGDGDSIVHF